MVERSPQRQAWAACGAMALTGRPDGPPLVPPDGIVDRTTALGTPLDVDVLALLGERAAVAGLTRGGDVSCGGAAHLVPTLDGWLAVSLARDDDLALLPAWLGLEHEPNGDPWPVAAAALARRATAESLAQATLLGLPVSAVASVAPPDRDPVLATRLRAGSRHGRPPLVVDLSSLWAGPLCARLLGDRGARVVKVESVDRPDGARRGPPAFYDLLHGGHESVALDLRSPDGVDQLRRLLLAADVVIEASRPRALRQLGIDADQLVAAGPDVWVSITGHGRAGEEGGRVAFGDDAAAAGGLVAHDGGGLCFVADAIADPLSGIAAAAATVDALERGGGWLLDVSMSRVAAHVAGAEGGTTWAAGADGEATAPVAPTVTARAPSLGEHTDAVLRDL
jgi:crotonobetainyl-CoA:carnitine CoA-transferase CaiB-like acyl-CoA transferase